MTDTVDSLKQRLVGAFVIVTLAIIFLPMIFDKPHQEDSVVIVPIPPKPQFKTIEISQPVQPTFERLENNDEGKVVELSSKASKLVNVDDSDRVADKNEAASKVKVVQPAKETRTDKKATNLSKEPKVKKPETKSSTSTKPVVEHLSVFKNVWMVQLGTFSNIKNAYKLRDQLRKDGFDGHTKEMTLKGKKAIKVFSGPFVKKREALKVKKRLDKKYKVDSRVVFFDR